MTLAPAFPTACPRGLPAGFGTAGPVTSTRSAASRRTFGEVAEWSNAPHSKCGIRATVSGVRIPPSPPWFFHSPPIEIPHFPAFLPPGTPLRECFGWTSQGVYRAGYRPVYRGNGGKRPRADRLLGRAVQGRISCGQERLTFFRLGCRRISAAAGARRRSGSASVLARLARPGAWRTFSPPNHGGASTR